VPNRKLELLRDINPEWNDLEGLREHHRSKYMNRKRMLVRKFVLMDAFFPEYEKGGFKVLDVSCASGAMLEILRYFKNEIFGTDVGYFAFMKSQHIPHEYMNCTIFPYPLSDKSYDLITCLGSFTFYRPFPALWQRVLDEFARISRKTIFITINEGPNFDKFSYLLNEWRHKEWKLVMYKKYYYKWERINE